MLGTVVTVVLEGCSIINLYCTVCMYYCRQDKMTDLRMLPNCMLLFMGVAAPQHRLDS